MVANLNVQRSPFIRHDLGQWYNKIHFIPFI